MQYEIVNAMHADNPQGKSVPFKSGQIITEEDMLAGCLEAGLARQTIKPYIAPVAEPVKPPEPEPEPQEEAAPVHHARHGKKK